MQILERLRRLFFYSITEKAKEKEKSLKKRQKRVRQKEDRENPCFLRLYLIVKDCAKRRSRGTNQAQFFLFSLYYRVFLCSEQMQEGRIVFLRFSFLSSETV